MCAFFVPAGVGRYVGRYVCTRTHTHAHALVRHTIRSKLHVVAGVRLACDDQEPGFLACLAARRRTSAGVRPGRRMCKLITDAPSRCRSFSLYYRRHRPTFRDALLTHEQTTTPANAVR